LACGKVPSLSLLREKKFTLTEIIARGWSQNPAERMSLMEMKTLTTPYGRERASQFEEIHKKSNKKEDDDNDGDDDEEEYMYIDVDAEDTERLFIPYPLFFSFSLFPMF
jgi:hypothetical protein